MTPVEQLLDGITFIQRHLTATLTLQQRVPRYVIGLQNHSCYDVPPFGFISPKLWTSGDEGQVDKGTLSLFHNASQDCLFEHHNQQGSKQTKTIQNNSNIV